MPVPATFAELAAHPDPPLDLIALALAAEFREVDGEGALVALDTLGLELRERIVREERTPAAELAACARLLGEEQGFDGDRDQYDRPENSMLDIVIERRRGLPILLSIVYVEVARRAGIDLRGVGLPGHFVAGHFGASPPLLLDPFAGGVEVDAVDPALVSPWPAHQIALRMLNNLAGAYELRGNISAAIRAAEMRLLLPAEESQKDALRTEHLKLQARMN